MLILHFYAGVPLRIIAPPADDAKTVYWALLLLLSSAVALFWAGRRKGPQPYRPLADLTLVFFPLFAFVWIKLPAIGPLGVLDIMVCLFILTMLFRCLYHDRKDLRLWGLSKSNFIGALKMLWAPTLLFVLVPAVWGTALHGPLHPGRILLATATYPFYALAQLLMFLAFPVARFKRMSRSSFQIILATAGLFALIHWPNGILMTACFLAMLVWSWVYLRRSNLFAIALSMGIAAGVFTQMLPEHIHHNMRAGPYYVYRRLIRMPPEIVFPHLFQDAAASNPPVQGGFETPVVERLFPALLERKPSAFSRSIWTHIQARWGAAAALKSFLLGAEARGQWHRLLSWPTRISAPKSAHGDFYGFLDRYERRPTQLELSGWMADVKRGRPAKHFLVYLNGRKLAAAPPNFSRDDVNKTFNLPERTVSGFLYKYPISRDTKIQDVRIFGIGDDDLPREIIYPPGYAWLVLFAGE